MKRFFTAFLLVLLVPSLLFAAGACVENTSLRVRLQNPDRFVLVLDCTGDSGDGSFAAFTLNPDTYGVRGWYAITATTNPGSTAPTAAYDIEATNVIGAPVFRGMLANRSAADTERVDLTLGGAPPMATGNWSLAITNNAVASATVRIEIEFTEE